MTRANTPITARMDELSGSGPYQRNLFRVSGLPTNATAVDLRRQRWLAEDDSEVGRVLDDLTDPLVRIVDELFWLWDVPNADCDCPSTLHRDHDFAVRAHAGALGISIADPGVDDPPEPVTAPELREPSQRARDPWLEAADAWSALLRRAAFWDHVRSRIRTLDDRRLDESAVATLRSGLPRVLVAPQIQLAARANRPKRLTRFLDHWDLDGTVVADLLDEVTAPLYRRIEDTTLAASGELDRGNVDAAYTLLIGLATKDLIKLEHLHPHEQHRRAAVVRDRVAVLLNNVALAAERTDLSTTRGERLFGLAADLASTERTRATVVGNYAETDERLQLTADLRPFGLTTDDDWPNILSERLTDLVDSGDYVRAKSVLTFMRKYVHDAASASEMDSMLRSLNAAIRVGRPTRSRQAQHVDRQPTRAERRSARTGAARPVIRGRPRAGERDLYRLNRQILDPVRTPGLVYGTGAVRTWAQQVILANDEKHLYLLLQVWWLVSRDPSESAQIHAYITQIWDLTNGGRRPLRGLRWALAILAGAAAAVLTGIRWGVLWALLAVVVVLALEVVALGLVVGRGWRKIAEYFPDVTPAAFPRTRP
jgi:hypothetical protein